jgi:CubicO group peptidase (beta-lactamase class C family)
VLEEAIDADSETSLGTISSMLVSVDGRLITEHYRGETTASTHTHVWSVTKSIVSTLVGIAVAEGKIDSLDQTVRELLPRHRRHISEDLSRVTLRQLLTMSSGLTDQAYYNETSGRDDRLVTLLGLPLATEPGTSFNYSNVGAHLVASIVAERAGMPLLDFARSRLFAPLGIPASPAYTGDETALRPSLAFRKAEFAWATTADGMQHGCCMLKLTGRDMIKIGQLYLQDGAWNGRQILPRGWARQATKASAASPDYGLLWWRGSVSGHPSYYAAGAFGQLILVVPDLSAVITVSSQPGAINRLQTGDLLDLIEDVIIPEIE